RIPNMGKKPALKRLLIVASLSFVALVRIEERVRQVDAASTELVREFGPDASGLKVPHHLAVRIYARLPESENFLHRHDLTFHARYFWNAGDLALTVRQPVPLHDDRDGRRDLLSCCLVRQIHASHANHVLEARNRIAGIARV